MVTGHTPARDRPDYWDGGISWVNLNEIRPLDGNVCTETELQISSAGVANSSAVVHPAGTVCMSRTASVGFVTVMGQPMATSQDFVNWICGPEIDPGYLMKALRASRPHILSLCSGSTHKTMYVRDAERLRVLLPPIEEQRRIAAILDAADALRAKRRQAIAKLDTLTQAIFIDVLGDPTSTERWPTKKLGHILDRIDSGKSPVCHARPAVDDEWGVLKLGAVTYCEFDERENKALPEDVAIRPQDEVQPGDLLFTRKNTMELVGAAAYVFETRPKLLLSDLTFRLVPRDPNEMHPIFLQQVLVTPSMRRHVQRLAGGSAASMPNISKAKLETVEVIVPPVEVQRRFADHALSVRRERARQQSWSNQLDTLFASLQQRAFRGEL